VYRVRFNNKDYTNGEFPALKSTRVGTKEYGDRAKYYKPFLIGMKAGDVIDVPFGKYKGPRPAIKYWFLGGHSLGCQDFYDNS
jgi:hypothetical protein